MKPFEPDILPLRNLEWGPLVSMLGEANRELARFDGLIHGMPNPAVLLSPITTQEAVLSSRIEGTVATLSDVLRFEAGELFPDEEKRNDIGEIRNYRKAMQRAEIALKTDPFNLRLLLELHSILLDSVRGKDKLPGRFRTDQNWIGPPGATLDEATFVPPNPIDLPSHLTNWENYYHASEPDPLVQLAVVHAQFEVLHPFNDGNGRIGRMLVPLFLQEKRILSRPMFYLSAYFDSHRDEYIQQLRELGQPGSWERWIKFFLTALAVQAAENAAKAKAILALYEKLKTTVLECTHSQYAVPLLDLLFDRPALSASAAAKVSGMPSLAMVSTLLKTLEAKGVVREVVKGRGRRPTIYIMHQLVNLCEGKTVF